MKLRYVLILVMLFLVACTTQNERRTLIATPAPLVFTPLETILHEQSDFVGAQVSTAGYLLVDSSGARLVDGVSFSSDEAPIPLSEPSQQLWIDTPAPVTESLRSAGDIQFGAVIAHGQISELGAYGPEGSYRFQLTDSQIQPLVPREATIRTILDESAQYNNQFVRINGALLISRDSALLVERATSTGIPEPETRQVKLQQPVRDVALLERLQGSADGVQFGKVQVEGFWRDGLIVPLSITPLS